MDHDASGDTAPSQHAEQARLIRKARWGDHDAFARLYRQHAGAVHALAFRLTGNTAAAEDITQDVFMKLLRFLGGIRPDAPLRPWLKRVTANQAIDRLRREQPQRVQPLDAWDMAVGDPAPGPDLHAENANLLRRLPPLVRTVVWLHEMEGWSHPELAERFGRSPSWSKSVLSRGLAQLRAELDEPPATRRKTPEGVSHDA